MMEILVGDNHTRVKKNYFLLGSLLLASMANVALLGSSSSVLAAPDLPAVSAPVPAAAPNFTDGGASLENTGILDAEPQSVFCTFYTRGDNVHISSSPPREASGHGWWENRNCPSNSAVVTVQLQQYYSDGRWRNVGRVGRATVRSGGGAGNRATGRAACNSNNISG